VDTVLVSLGRIALEKSVDVLVAAFAIAARRRPRLRLLLVGSGPAEVAVARQAAAAGVADRIHVTGRLPRHDALSLVKACDLFVFASQTETQGLVLAEALAAGLPVAAVDGPGVTETLRPGVDAVVVPADPAETRAERLAAEIGSLLGNRRLRDRMAAEALAGAMRFDADRRVAEVADLYAEVLASRVNRVAVADVPTTMP
jgi:glycosyltransferase involved in cell wall biosynthesis